MNDQHEREAENEKPGRRPRARGRKAQRTTAVGDVTPFEPGALLTVYAAAGSSAVNMPKEGYEVGWRLSDLLKEAEERIIHQLRRAATDDEQWAKAVLWPRKENGKYVPGRSDYSPYNTGLSDEKALKRFYSWLDREQRRRLGLKG